MLESVFHIALVNIAICSLYRDPLESIYSDMIRGPILHKLNPLITIVFNYNLVHNNVAELYKLPLILWKQWTYIIFREVSFKECLIICFLHKL